MSGVTQLVCIKVMNFSAVFLALIVLVSVTPTGSSECDGNVTVRENRRRVVTKYVNRLYGGWPWTDCAGGECEVRSFHICVGALSCKF